MKNLEEFEEMIKNPEVKKELRGMVKNSTDLMKFCMSKKIDPIAALAALSLSLLSMAPALDEADIKESVKILNYTAKTIVESSVSAGIIAKNSIGYMN